MASSAATRRAPRKRRKSSPKQSAGSIWPWVGALVLVAGGIAAYDNRGQLPKLVANYLPKAASRPEPQARPSPPRASSAVGRSEAPKPPAPIGSSAARQPVPNAHLEEDALVGRGFSGTFYFCGTSGLDNCVATGNTFWHRKTKIVLADIVAPETEKARCQNERDKGFAAIVRLRDLLNAGAFELAAVDGQSGDAGRHNLRIVSRGGRSLGSILVSEGLARARAEKGQPWC